MIRFIRTGEFKNNDCTKTKSQDNTVYIFNNDFFILLTLFVNQPLGHWHLLVGMCKARIPIHVFFNVNGRN